MAASKTLLAKIHGKNVMIGGKGCGGEGRGGDRAPFFTVPLRGKIILA